LCKADSANTWNDLQLLGREYYQGSLSEPLLVLAPLTVHALSGILKRLLSPPNRPPRRISHLLSLTGYASFFIFLPIHFLTHRQYPTLESSPIYSVGPSELDYEFVKTGLQTWPIRSWFLYGGLILSTTVHFVDGMTIIWNTWLKKDANASWKRNTCPTRMVLGIGAIALPTLLGLYALAKEPMMTFASMANRYRAVFMSSFIYRI